MMARKGAFVFAACLLFVRPDAVHRPDPAGARDPSLLVDDAPTLMWLEASGYAFNDVVSPAKRGALGAAVRADMAEFTKGLTKDSVRRPFRTAWLTDARFELVGVVNRLDRRAFDLPGGPTCGEVRLVYRLAFQGEDRPVTRLPMTVNVRIPQPVDASGGCRTVAEKWKSGGDVLGVLRSLSLFTKLEINFQSIHVPSYRTDMDDNAEYVLRAFKVVGDSLVPDVLFNTPRVDLTASERDELQGWILENVATIQSGEAVVPEKFLAIRRVSVSPRGLSHLSNRPFSQLFRDARQAFGDVRPDPARLVTTPELLLRRLDEATCPGCHQSRGIAGFHLLGEERDPAKFFNALAVGHSPHLGAELGWRARVLTAVARGEPTTTMPRPFSGRSNGPGGSGAACGLAVGFEEWTCAPGLVCRDLQGAALGVCAPAQGSRPGDPCETVTARPDPRPEGEVVTSAPPDSSCPAARGAQLTGVFCAPNALGFMGGMCSERCSKAGEVEGGSVCAQLPAARYEADCFYSREPVESCLERHYATARIATCDAQTPCRDDYACTRVPGLRPSAGACVPPYFVFQVRVDGPVLDR